VWSLKELVKMRALLLEGYLLQRLQCVINVAQKMTLCSTAWPGFLIGETKTERPKIDAEGRQYGWGSCGGGGCGVASPSLPARVSWAALWASQRGSGRSRDRPKVFHYSSTQDGHSWHYNIGLLCIHWGDRTPWLPLHTVRVSPPQRWRLKIRKYAVEIFQNIANRLQSCAKYFVWWLPVQ